MRIGILTLPLHTNYGGVLQAWALQTVLDGMGHHVEVFGLKKRGRNPAMMPLVWCKRALLRMLGRSSVPVFHEVIENRRQRRMSANLSAFIRNNISIRMVKGLDAIPRSRYDAIVVGSDQIWRKEYIGYLWRCNDVSRAFLSGMGDTGVRKVAYAASFGVDRWQFSAEETEAITAALGSFSAISVRELSGVRLLKEHVGKDAAHVLDPTMLLAKEKYIALIGDGEPIAGGVTSYILDPDEEKSRIVGKAVALSGAAHIELNRAEDDGAAISIERWLAGIAYARVVVTDSFHGCVFSLIFGKPLIFIKNSGRGNTRFDSLIETFGLQCNLVERAEDVTDIESFALGCKVDKTIAEYRSGAMEFLRKSL